MLLVSHVVSCVFGPFALLYPRSQPQDTRLRRRGKEEELQGLSMQVLTFVCAAVRRLRSSSRKSRWKLSATLCGLAVADAYRENQVTPSSSPSLASTVTKSLRSTLCSGAGPLTRPFAPGPLSLFLLQNKWALLMVLFCARSLHFCFALTTGCPASFSAKGTNH